MVLNPSDSLLQLVIERLDRMSETNAVQHAETVERLARLETEVKDLRGLPDRVVTLEKSNSRWTGAVAAVSAVISAFLTYLNFRH